MLAQHGEAPAKHSALHQLHYCCRCHIGAAAVLHRDFGRIGLSLNVLSMFKTKNIQANGEEFTLCSQIIPKELVGHSCDDTDTIIKFRSTVSRIIHAVHGFIMHSYGNRSELVPPPPTALLWNTNRCLTCTGATQN